ncbi:hypothetical protein [Dongia rigui]|uniref:Uncharacterized protein n=1 Tax=Dongia rigui TaxID=940149 RepID=A0ABU5DXT1_9PROT|nr:hypothetical protein [Dongia rigui]MDY0871518.1 hypothetical protein [Dongia rigui]
MLATGSAIAQNNTGYPSGTKCSDLIEPRRSACIDAFDPRPNPREIINKPPSGAVTPPSLRPLGQDPFPTDPRVPHTLPPPFIKKQNQ